MNRRAFLASAAAACFAESGPPVREYRRGGMIYRQLGQTDINVSLLSFGSHTDPRFKVKTADHNILNQEGQQRRDRLIAGALDMGVNMVDTYESEGQWEPLARVVRGRREKTLSSVCWQFPMF